MKKMLAISLTLLLACAALSACGSDQDSESADPPKEPEKQPTITLTSEDGTASLEAPEDWTLRTDGILTGAALEIAVGEEGEEDAFAVVIHEEKPLDDAGAASMTLAEYSDQVVEQMTDPQNLVDAAATSPSSVKVGADDKNAGLDAILTEIDGSTAEDNGGIPFHYWIYCVDNGDYFSQVIGWTSQSRLETFADSIPAMLRTFRSGAVPAQ